MAPTSFEGTPIYPAARDAQDLKPATLRMANVVGENSWFGRQHKWWAAEVERRSAGKLKVQIFWMESLVKWKDALPGIQSGVADFAWAASNEFVWDATRATIPERGAIPRLNQR